MRRNSVTAKRTAGLKISSDENGRRGCRRGHPWLLPGVFSKKMFSCCATRTALVFVATLTEYGADPFLSRFGRIFTSRVS
jgi:hypothetical protein